MLWGADAVLRLVAGRGCVKLIVLDIHVCKIQFYVYVWRRDVEFDVVLVDDVSNKVGDCLGGSLGPLDVHALTTGVRHAEALSEDSNCG